MRNALWSTTSTLIKRSSRKRTDPDCPFVGLVFGCGGVGRGKSQGDDDCSFDSSEPGGWHSVGSWLGSWVWSLGEGKSRVIHNTRLESLFQKIGVELLVRDSGVRASISQSRPNDMRDQSLQASTTNRSNLRGEQHSPSIGRHVLCGPCRACSQDV